MYLEKCYWMVDSSYILSSTLDKQCWKYEPYKLWWPRLATDMHINIWAKITFLCHYKSICAHENIELCNGN